MERKQIDEIQGILREMQEEYWRGIEEGTESVAAETRDYVVFCLGGERFGLPSTVCREILRIPRLVRVPRVGEHILGVINLRGQIVAVTDLRSLLGLSGREVPAKGQLVVVEAAGLLTALLAEKVEGIQAIPLEAIEPLTEGLAGFPRDAAEGQVADKGGLLVLLDPTRILSRPEFVVNQKAE
jgi:purine-binding chemotaxis protein CheW